MTILIKYFLLKLHMHTMYANKLHVANEQTAYSVIESFQNFTSIILLQNPSSHQLKTMIQMFCCCCFFLAFCAMFCTSLFIFFYLLAIYCICLSFVDLQLLITPLVFATISANRLHLLSRPSIGSIVFHVIMFSSVSQSDRIYTDNNYEI